MRGGAGLVCTSDSVIRTLVPLLVGINTFSVYGLFSVACLTAPQNRSQAWNFQDMGLRCSPFPQHLNSIVHHQELLLGVTRLQPPSS
ncbi:hypothetical protein LX32DRAFT_290032 [Colletotrichum zoysiae]|uniref:Uncharacterized protein n=1 Tax=Colletotrichum zoysiae TaxID=1216348 RepID=A0AAD9H1S2_9PEZI|nr:hypothetical protein LX32DRAFT_290032 [Colletotrichum zoysiae]